MESVDGVIKKQQTKNNSLYCITVKGGQDHLEEAFVLDSSSYMDSDDGNYVAGFDVNNESIYFVYFEKWKVIKMIDFFRKHNIFLGVEKVDMIIDFINSDKKYLSVYSEEHNRVVINNYIRLHVTPDNVLERMFENKNKSDFELMEIEKEILSFA